MSNRKSNTGVVLASLLGLMGCLALGAWLMLQDGGDKPAQRPSKPAAEARR
jgi:hypothetical protein